MKRAVVWGLPAVFVLFGALPACKHDEAKPGPSAIPSASGSASTAPIAKRAPRKVVALASSSAAAKPMGEEEAKRLLAYKTALDEGRKKTAANETDAAIRAFDRALQEKLGDPQALSERGNAKLALAKRDLGGAAKDFDLALAGGGDAKLRAQIWFNVGLVRELRGDAGGAATAFAASNALNPTAAAASKIAGKTTCSAVVDRSRDGATRVVSWLGVYRAVRPNAGTPASAEAAKATLCEDGTRAPRCASDPPYFVLDEEGNTLAAVVPGGGTFFVVPNVAQRSAAGGFKCPTDLPFVSGVVDRGTLHVTVEEALCRTAYPEAWSGALGDVSSSNDGKHAVDTWWTMASAHRLVTVARDEAEGITVEEKDGAVVASGKGCAVNIPIPYVEQVVRSPK